MKTWENNTNSAFLEQQNSYQENNKLFYFFIELANEQITRCHELFKKINLTSSDILV